jgi:hypothetical protein
VSATASTDDGGPAFPQLIKNDGDHNVLICGDTVPPGWSWYAEGMRLRDYFAAKAMQAFVGRWDGHDSYDEGGGSYARVAEHAYGLADAMLKARAATGADHG